MEFKNKNETLCSQKIHTFIFKKDPITFLLQGNGVHHFSTVSPTENAISKWWYILNCKLFPQQMCSSLSKRLQGFHCKVALTSLSFPLHHHHEWETETTVQCKQRGSTILEAVFALVWIDLCCVYSHTDFLFTCWIKYYRITN